MLSPIIKELLATKLGKDIRYPYDLEHLSYDIEKYTQQRISVNTLKRLFGLIEGVKEPRLYTLDVIAHYLDFKNWDDLINHLSNTGNSEFSSIEEIEVKSLQDGDKICFCYTPDRRVIIEYIKNNHFVVWESLNSKLQKNDIVEIHHFVLHYPLLINNVIRDNISLGKFTAGKVSGIISLELVRK